MFQTEVSLAHSGRPGWLEGGLLSAVVATGTVLLLIPQGPVTLFAAGAILAAPFCGSFYLKSSPGWFLRFWIIASGIVCLLGSVLHSRQMPATAFQFIYPLMIFGVAVCILWFGQKSITTFCHIGLGVGLGLCAGYFLQPAGVVIGEPLKSGLGAGLVIVIASTGLLLSLSVRLLALSLVVFGIIAMFSDARNLAAACVAAGVVSIVCVWFQTRYSLGFWSALLCLTGCTLISLVLITEGYSIAASSGVLGPSAEARYEKQAEAEGGLLLSARPELALSLAAIRSDPIVGRGANPRASFSERSQAINTLLGAGRELSDEDVERIAGRGVNSHSLALHWWVMFGISGFLIWLIFLLLLVCASVFAIVQRSSFAVLIIYATLQSAWDIFFSPWNARFEVLWGFYLAVCVATIAASVDIPARSRVGAPIEHS